MWSHTKIIANAVIHLNSLGSTPSKIAAELLKRGVKGDIGESKTCILARELQRANKEFADVEIGASGFVMLKPHCEDHQTPDLAPPVQEFMRRFDRGVYPKLVQRYPRKRKVCKR